MHPFFKSRFQEVLFLGISMLAFIAFYIETDIYTPSFPEMMTYFSTNEETIQMLLSMNFLGLCLSSLFFGPASDAYGRKAMLCVGLSMFMVASLGCSLTESLDWMIFFRFCQGLGCGAIVSAGLAQIFDIYPPDKSSQLASLLNGTVGGMMALAPLIGNWISLHMGWRTNFYLIAFLAALAFFSTLGFTKETLPKEKRSLFSPISILEKYGSLLSNFPFMAHSLIWCLMFSMVIVFIANLSLIFIDYLKVPQEIYGYYQTAIMAAFFMGSMGAAFLIKKLGMIFTKVLGSLLFIGSSLWLALLSYLNSDSPVLLVAAMALASFGSALSMTIYFSYSMSHISENLKGAAMSITQSLRIFLSSSLVWLAAYAFDGSTKPMSILAILCTAICALLYAGLYRMNQHVVVSTTAVEVLA